MNGLLGKIGGLIARDVTPGYVLGEPVATTDGSGAFALHRATARDGGAAALAFVFDPATPRTTAASYGAPPPADLAKAGLAQLRRLKHPDVLRYVASAEHPDGGVFVATEPATPLSVLLSHSSDQMSREAIQWGLFTISRALGFLHQSGLIHGRVNAASVFVTPSGDWKLGGLENVTQHANAASQLGRAVAVQQKAYLSPECQAGNWSAVAGAAPGAVDSWALGCLMYHAHSGSLTSPEQLMNTACIPKGLMTAYQKLLASNPSSRAPAAQVPNHPYFKSSKFVELNMFVENLALKGEMEREAFLGKLPTLMDRLPDGFCTFKILPMLSQSIVKAQGAMSAFACVVKMKDRLPEPEFANTVVKGHASNWYGNATLDRTLRVEMLGKIDMFAPLFDSAAINGPIFNAMGAAMQDAQAPALRDAAVKAVVSIVPSLTEKNLNSALMSHFARLQVDPEPAIRTNTTVCLGRIAPRLNASTRNKVLTAAFMRSLKDPFPPARAAGTNAILATVSMFDVKDIAMRVLPGLCPLLVDQATDVRTLAFKVLAAFQPILERNNESMTRAAGGSSAGGAPGGGGASYGMAHGTQNGGASGTANPSSSGGWGLGSLTSMTSALLSKPEASSTNRAASGGISSDDFKNGAAVRPTLDGQVGAVSSRPPAQGGATPAAPAAFSSAPLAVMPNGNPSVGMDPFGDFQSAGAEEDDDDDADGWGDMNIKDKTKGGDEEEDFLAILGPPIGASTGRKPGVLPGGLTRSVSGASGVSTGTAGTGGTGDAVWDSLPPQQVTTSRPAARKPALPTSNTMGVAPPPRRPAKKSGGDDWEALLNGSSSTSSRRKGLGGATRR